MKIGKILLYLLLFFVLINVLGYLFIPKDVHVERSIDINQEAETVFAQVNDLRKWEKWSPWYAMEPTMELKYDGVTGKGAKYSWKGEKTGEGSLKITDSQPYKSLKTHIEFVGMGDAHGSWKFDENNGKTTATWGLDTELGPFIWERIGYFFMEGGLGPQFEDGLARLKTYAESEPKYSVLKANKARIQQMEIQKNLEEKAKEATKK